MAVGSTTVTINGIDLSGYLVAVDFGKGTPVDKAAALQKRINELQQELIKVELMPTDEYEDGEVVWFRKRFSTGTSRLYTYAAVKAAGAWWISGSAQHNDNRLSWERLLEFAGWGEPWFEMYWASQWEVIDG